MVVDALMVLFAYSTDHMPHVKTLLLPAIGTNSPHMETGFPCHMCLVVVCAPTEANPNTQLKEEYWKILGHMVEQIPTKECLFVLVGANARTGKRMDGCGEGRVLGAYGRDELNNNGKRLLTFAKDNKLALTNTFFITRKGTSITYVQRHQQSQ